MDEGDDRRRWTLLHDLFGKKARIAIPQGQFGLWIQGGPWEFRGRISGDELGFTLLLVMVAAAIFRIVFHTVDDAADEFVHRVPYPAVRDAIGVVVLAFIGWRLSVLRANRRLLYAVVELGVATTVAWGAAAGMGAHNLSAWVTPLTAAYLFVRGIENFKEGLAQTRPDSPP
jgi:hypothetical protein